MQLTRAADYAVRVMAHLAGLAPGTRASRGDLAEAADCPEQFLSKVLQSLTHAGLVVSHRGNTGGFELPPNGDRASMLEVIEAVEGPLLLNLCLASDRTCPRRPYCQAYVVWDRAQSAVVEVLRGATIADLAKGDAAFCGRSEPAVKFD